MNHQTQAIHVTDNGPGIPDDMIDKIFDPFISKHSNGFGLGLAICRKLCQENRATIQGKNNPDAGCTFTVLIPKHN